MNKLNESCPICIVGKNDTFNGGSENCFHCDTCGWVECQIRKPEEGYTPIGYVKEHLKQVEVRLKKYYEIKEGQNGEY